MPDATVSSDIRECGRPRHLWCAGASCPWLLLVRQSLWEWDDAEGRDGLVRVLGAHLGEQAVDAEEDVTQDEEGDEHGGAEGDDTAHACDSGI